MHFQNRSLFSPKGRRTGALLIVLMLVVLAVAGCDRIGGNPVGRVVNRVLSLLRRAPEEEEPVVEYVMTEDDTLWAEEDSIWAEEEMPAGEAEEEVVVAQVTEEEPAAEQPVEEVEAPEGAVEEVSEEISEEIVEEIAGEIDEEALGELMEEEPEVLPEELPPEKLAKAFGQEEYYYERKGRRDPFHAVSPTEGGVLALDVNNLSLIGTMRGSKVQLGLFKDRLGMGYVLRQGDKVAGGRVAAITEDSVVFELTQFGAVSRVTISLGVETY